MRRIKHVVFVLLATFIVPILHAETFCAEQQLKTTVVFGNGIMNTEEDAIRSRNRLEDLLRNSLSEKEFSRLEFDLAYNKSYGFLKDLYESAKQKLGSDNTITSFWRWMGDWEAMPDSIQKSAEDIATRFDFSTRVAPEDLSSHIKLYRGIIEKGGMVLLEAHSQGNSFANAAYQKLFEGDDAIEGVESFRIISVATPASYVAGDGPYTTLVEDAVIAAVSIATPIGIAQPLPSNITNVLSGASMSDLKGHSYIDEYMADGSRTVEKVIDDTIMGIQGLQQTVSVSKERVVTITASWNSQSDTHYIGVIESDQREVVDESNPIGVYGEFSTSDVNGTTTNSYVISCDTVDTILITMFVEDYEDDLGTVSVHIESGTQVSDYDVEFIRDQDREDVNVLGIASILVYEDPGDGFRVQIREEDLGL